MFDCPFFSHLRSKLPSLDTTLRSIQGSKGFAEISDLGLLLNAIQNDSRLGFSVASFVRQAIPLKDSWLRETCVRGRLCTPPDHWRRDLFEDPPSEAELPPDFEQSFDDGAPSMVVIQWYEDGTNAVVYPEKYANGEFTLPSWVKK